MPDNIEFRGGAHSPASFQHKFFTPLFESGVITRHPKAAYYAVCYGELCVYDKDDVLVATWSKGVPDVAKDVKSAPGPYTGEWIEVKQPDTSKCVFTVSVIFDDDTPRSHVTSTAKKATDLVTEHFTTVLGKMKVGGYGNRKLSARKALESWTGAHPLELRGPTGIVVYLSRCNIDGGDV